MTKPLNIPRPNLTDATPLTAAQLNELHFAGTHTPLTPTQLEALATAAQEANQQPTAKK